MSKIAFWCVFVGALALALTFRLANPGARPMHHDEANQAVRFGTLLETGEYHYDPVDHHGPTLYYLTLPVAWARGQHTLADLDERTLRLVPALFGVGLILLFLFLAASRPRSRTTIASTSRNRCSCSSRWRF
jgi:predicted membrane-bound mannosyltransferase